MKSCKEVAKLSAPNTKLSLKQKIEIKIHKSFCKICQDYEKQIKSLSKIYTNLSNKKNSDSIDGQSKNDKLKKFEDEIIEKLKK